MKRRLQIIAVLPARQSCANFGPRIVDGAAQIKNSGQPRTQLIPQGHVQHDDEAFDEVEITPQSCRALGRGRKISPQDAVTLFVEQARDISPELEKMRSIPALARVCRRPNQLALNRAVLDPLLEQNGRAERTGRRNECRTEVTASAEIQLPGEPKKRAHAQKLPIKGLFRKLQPRKARSRFASALENPECPAAEARVGAKAAVRRTELMPRTSSQVPEPRTAFFSRAQ